MAISSSRTLRLGHHLLPDNHLPLQCTPPSTQREAEDRTRLATAIANDLFGQFVFADEFDIPALRRQLVRRVAREFNICADRKEECAIPNLRQVQYVFSRPPSSSTLCRLVVQTYARRWDPSIFTADMTSLENISPAFLVAVMARQAVLTKVSVEKKGNILTEADLEMFEE